MNNKSKLSRRRFLSMAAAGTCGAAIHGAASPFGNMLAYALPSAGPSSVLVLVNLSGGASYNICPLYNGTYFDRNPTISFQPQDSIPLSPAQGLHPSLVGLRSIWDEGRLGIVNMVGYPNPNRSHDESTQIWFRGLRQNAASTTGGWGARLTCETGGLFAGVSLGGSNLLIQGECNPPRAFGDLSNFGERNFWGGDDGTNWLRITRDQAMSVARPLETDNYNYVRGSIDRLALSLDSIRRETANDLPVAFPNTGFGRSCRDAAKLISARSLGVRLIYLEHGGFDTHSGERDRMRSLLAELNGGLTALVAAVKAAGRWQDTIVTTMSEFGRTHENGSGGTDHGHGSPMLIFGGSVSGGFRSPAPDGNECAKGAFFENYYVDSRQVFKECVAAMALNADTVFPETISSTPLNLFT